MQQLRLFFAMALRLFFAIAKNKSNCCILLETFYMFASKQPQNLYDIHLMLYVQS